MFVQITVEMQVVFVQVLATSLKQIFKWRLYYSQCIYLFFNAVHNAPVQINNFSGLTNGRIYNVQDVTIKFDAEL